MGKKSKAFVDVHLHCIVSNLKRISKISTLPPLEKFLRTPMIATIDSKLLLFGNVRLPMNH